jgi:hypothetical protein
MGMESYDAFRARLDGAAISTFILATLAVPAKLWCRTRVGGWSNIGMDDWLSIATLFWMNVFFWITMIGKAIPPFQPDIVLHFGFHHRSSISHNIPRSTAVSWSRCR